MSYTLEEGSSFCDNCAKGLTSEGLHQHLYLSFLNTAFTQTCIQLYTMWIAHRIICVPKVRDVCKYWFWAGGWLYMLGLVCLHYPLWTLTLSMYFYINNLLWALDCRRRLRPQLLPCSEAGTFCSLGVACALCPSGDKGDSGLWGRETYLHEACGDRLSMGQHSSRLRTGIFAQLKTDFEKAVMKMCDFYMQSSTVLLTLLRFSLCY